MTRLPGAMSSSAITDKIDRYFLSIPANAATDWETNAAHRILRSFCVLSNGLKNIQPGGQSWLVLDRFQTEWDAAEGATSALLQTLGTPRDTRTSGCTGVKGDATHTAECLICSSRQAARTLREYVVLLARAAGLDDADEGALEALTTMLHGAAVEIAQLHTELCSTGVQAAELLPADQPPANSGGTRVAQDALATATALAEMLRGFTRAARQGWTAARSQLAHMPSVPSPLSSGGSAQHHRRWVSEELEGESVAANRKPGASPDANRHGAGTLHARNRSDSRIQSASPHGVPLRKSALSLQRSSQPPGSPQPGADAAERAKQVRFQPSALGEPAVDQARLGELVQLLAKFEAAIALLGAVVQDRGAGGGGPAGRSDTYAQATKGLVAAFVQISRLSSTSGLVKHYDKAALAQFKTMTQGVKQLMAHPSSKA